LFSWNEVAEEEEEEEEEESFSHCTRVLNPIIIIIIFRMWRLRNPASILDGWAPQLLLWRFRRQNPSRSVVATDSCGLKKKKNKKQKIKQHLVVAGVYNYARRGISNNISRWKKDSGLSSKEAKIK
jgi:hypothetical protein